MVLSCTVSAFATEAKDDTSNVMGPSGDSMTDIPVTIEEQETAVLNDDSLSEANKNLFKKKFEEHRSFIARDLAISAKQLNSVAVIDEELFK